MDVKRVFSGAPWEKIVGYCRAIRNGNIIAVTGTVPLSDDGTPFAEGDAYLQTRRSLELIDKALASLSATRKDVIRTRLFVTDIGRWQEYGKAHGEFFREYPPATSMIEVKALIDPRFLIEIEADAVVGGQ